MKLIQHQPLLLASSSPRRKDYFSRYRLQFTVLPSEVDETPFAEEAPLAFARRLALEKATAVAAAAGNAMVLAADTIVVLDGQIIGKPADKSQVLPMLERLNGRTHEVITAYCLRGPGVEKLAEERTLVTFFQHETRLLKAYADTDEPLDKAGSYSIQGFGSFLVKSIEGSYNNVVGLPMERVLMDLIQFGVLSLEEAP